mmetsp:Transcript_74170/g.191352  ORF Transcript_74170/g.191352 Transcript_74170/m.191352 type:complete len:212 (+) Transcript_74170:1879-2514(+)
MLVHAQQVVQRHLAAVGGLDRERHGAIAELLEGGCSLLRGQDIEFSNTLHRERERVGAVLVDQRPEVHTGVLRVKDLSLGVEGHQGRNAFHAELGAELGAQLLIVRDRRESHLLVVVVELLLGFIPGHEDELGLGIVTDLALVLRVRGIELRREAPARGAPMRAEVEEANLLLRERGHVDLCTVTLRDRRSQQRIERHRRAEVKCMDGAEA